MPNPFAGSRGYARLSNLFMQPLYRLLPVPRGFALLTVIGRRSGRRLRRPVRAIRSGNTLYAVAMLGERSDWLRNVRKEPRVEVKVGGRRYGGVAREIDDPGELGKALEVYLQTFPADYMDYAGYHWGLPTRRKIEEAHGKWAHGGIMVAIDLGQEGGQ